MFMKWVRFHPPLRYHSGATAKRLILYSRKFSDLSCKQFPELTEEPIVTKKSRLPSQYSSTNTNSNKQYLAPFKVSSLEDPVEPPSRFLEVWNDDVCPQELSVEESSLSEEIASLNLTSSLKSKEKMEAILTDISIDANSDMLITREAIRLLSIKVPTFKAPKSKFQIPERLPPIITTTFPKSPDPRSLSTSSLNTYIYRLVTKNYGWNSVSPHSRLDIELQRIVLSKLVTLSSYINSTTLNLIIHFFSRIGELDMIAISITKFERLGIHPTTETFNEILCCVLHLTERGKISEPYKYVIPVLNKMKLRYHRDIDVQTMRLLLMLVKNPTNKLELVKAMTSNEMNLKACLKEVSRAFYIEYGEPEDFESFLNRIASFIPGNMRKGYIKRIFQSTVEVSLERNMHKALGAIQRYRSFVSISTIAEICCAFIQRGEYWHCIACANWFAQTSRSPYNGREITSKVIWYALLDFLRSREYMKQLRQNPYPLILLLKICEDHHLKGMLTNAMIRKAFRISEQGPATVSSDYLLQRLVWNDSIDLDTNFTNGEFNQAAKILGYTKK